MKEKDRQRYRKYQQKEIEAFQRARLAKFDEESGYKSGWAIVFGVIGAIIKVTLFIIAGLFAFVFAFFKALVVAFAKSSKR